MFPQNNICFVISFPRKNLKALTRSFFSMHYFRARILAGIKAVNKLTGTLIGLLRE